MPNEKRPAPVPGILGRVPVFGDLLAAGRLLVDRDARWWAKLLVVAAAVYVVSPVDAIPDLAPILTQLDDLGVVLAVRLLLHRQLGRYRYPLLGRAAPPTPKAEEPAAPGTPS